MLQLLERKVHETVLRLTSARIKHEKHEGCKFVEKCPDNSEAPNKKSKQIGNPTKGLLQLYAVIRCRIATKNGWTYERETVHPEEERQLFSEGTSPTETHEKCRTKHRNREQVGPSLWFVQGGAPHHLSPNAPTFADRDPKLHVVGRR